MGHRPRGQHGRVFYDVVLIHGGTLSGSFRFIQRSTLRDRDRDPEETGSFDNPVELRLD